MIFNEIIALLGMGVMIILEGLHEIIKENRVSFSGVGSAG